MNPLALGLIIGLMIGIIIGMFFTNLVNGKYSSVGGKNE
jgi:uncharacterized membrane-anchored protein YhcB (DUF1043 family)